LSPGIKRLFRFRLHGLDMAELNHAEVLLRRLAREFALEIAVSKVNEILEHGRMGIADVLPVLEINGFVVQKKASLTEDTLRPVFEGLSAIIKRELGGKP
jgi:glutamate formiminotransferase